jgi:hypothetical protein
MIEEADCELALPRSHETDDDNTPKKKNKGIHPVRHRGAETAWAAPAVDTEVRVESADDL